MIRPVPSHPSLCRRFPSRLAQVDGVCHSLRGFLSEHGVGQGTFAIELATRECLNNAILHGNRKDPAGEVSLTLRLGRRWLRVTVEDQGPGFNWRGSLRRPLDPTATSGRGLPILARYARRVSFNRPGNSVTLWFERSHPSLG